ncbi:hypothetical protein Belba_0875 [Belliella baltica DSM 15883]|uniref:Uncharacterized protein n=1 Tax=Belliella baltica (strain DSM 15883 / CIP 108006 / LMG 21964 / BA134) TaxID=866536 RepID=I3Z2Q4_BELBD|nr:hypothetical protein [Belliella baltica]AFL83522.1 hypothetical protein Belba_0875 [Belliella baltica DSM 15883]
MYQAHFSSSIDPNWMISEDDPDNKYIELLGYDREFLISISFEPDENVSKPYFLNFQQMKGAFQRYDYTTFGISCWHASPKETVSTAIELMKMVKINYPNFSPVSHEIYVGLGPVSEMDKVKNDLGGEFMVSDAFGKALVFKKVQFIAQDFDLIETACRIIKNYTSMFQVSEAEFIGGILCNEKAQYLGGLDYKGNFLNEAIFQNLRAIV